MPFGSFQDSKEHAFRNAARLIRAGRQMVKLEGGATMVETTTFLVERGIPVCAHIGSRRSRSIPSAATACRERARKPLTVSSPMRKALERAGAAFV
jgi:3-methyl-2-oxobutanoate hydroxymethyltransferase